MNIHIIGIGGIGASALARLLSYQGNIVTGSDMVGGDILNELSNEGIIIKIGSENLDLVDKSDLILVSPAVIVKEPQEYIYAKKQGKEIKTWQQYIGEITKSKRTIAICGAHGKSTTTAMVGLLLKNAGFDPTVIIGTKLREFFGKNLIVGDSEWFVIEADEYFNNFNNYYPEFILLTSYDVDHLDYYKNAENYKQAFIDFFSKLKIRKGSLFTHKKPEIESVVNESLEKNNFEIVYPEKLIDFDLKVHGVHMKENATLVYLLGKKLGISEDVIIQSLSQFEGTWRRMEYKGITSNGSVVYDDYGHHPTEVKATLRAFREKFPEQKITCVFQPHQYSRTRELIDDFAISFSDCDKLIIPNIYESRDSEEDKKAISVNDLISKIKSNGVDVVFGDGIENTLHLIKNNPEYDNDNSLIITMGAGDVTEVAGKLIS